MRRRWEFDPKPFAALWVIGGFVAGIVSMLLGVGPDAGVGRVMFFVWLSPFAIISGGAALFWSVAMLVWIVRAFWEARPRRVFEPVTTDLREAGRLSSK